MRIPRQIPFELGAPGAAPEALLPVVITVDDSDSPRDVIDALALTAFVAGHQPYATTKDLNNVRDDATLLPPGVQVLREAASETERARLAVGDGWMLRAVHWPRGKTATVGSFNSLATNGVAIHGDQVAAYVNAGARVTVPTGYVGFDLPSTVLRSTLRGSMRPPSQS